MCCITGKWKWYETPSACIYFLCMCILIWMKVLQSCWNTCRKSSIFFWVVGSDNLNVDDRIVAFVYTSIFLEFSIKFVLFGCSVILCVWPTDSGNACNCKNYFLSHKAMFGHANSLPINFLEYAYKATQTRCTALCIVYNCIWHYIIATLTCFNPLHGVHINYICKP